MNATQGIETTSDEDVIPVAPRRMRIDPSHNAEIATADYVPDQHLEPLDEAGVPSAIESEWAGPAMLEVEEPTAEMVAAVAGENLEIRHEQLQLEAAQLAEHLRERLAEVDRREGRLNAREAQLESDLRTSRMWLSERQAEFQDREAELLQRIEEHQERAELRGQEVETGVLAAEALQTEFSQREEQLRLLEDELRQRRMEIDRQAAALAQEQYAWQQELHKAQRRLADEFQRQADQLAAEREQMAADLERTFGEREEQVSSAEFLLNEQAEQLDRERTALLADRQAWEEQKARQRQAVDELRSATEAELADRRLRQEARQEWIERQKAGLEQVRDEALALHRQSLEMRLVAEQLWSQINGTMAAAEATRAMAQLRLKLAEQYRVEEEQLAARRSELLRLGEQIAEQHRELSQLKSGVREWAAARQAEIEQQAAALVERELTLDAQQQGFLKARHQWDCERRSYQQQIRELTSQLRAEPAAA
jgi:hypothetical protein